MKPFDNRSFERLSKYLAAGPGRHAVLHLLGGASVRCTAATYNEVLDQGGGFRSREITIRDTESPELSAMYILAEAVIGFELRGAAPNA